MSGSGLAAVILMVFAVMVVTSFWRQIAILLFYVAFAVFCFGIYYIVSTITYFT
jgi:hypothetical protein